MVAIILMIRDELHEHVGPCGLSGSLGKSGHSVHLRLLYKAYLTTLHITRVFRESEMDLVRGRIRRRTRRRSTTNTTTIAYDYVSSSFISDNLITEILLRTCASSVIRFKSVCKQWYSIIKDPNFIRKHVDHVQKDPSVSFAVLYYGHHMGHGNDVNSGYYLKTVSEGGGLTLNRQSVADDVDRSVVAIPETWSKNPKNIIRMWACNGLLCFCSHRIYICNPTTKESVTLPGKAVYKRPIGGLGFGYDAVNRQYKVVTLTTYDHIVSRNVSYNVFTLGDGSKSWRTTRSFKAIFCPSYGQSMYVDGSVYWLTENLTNNADKSILCFDVREERFKFIGLPYAHKERGKPRDTTMVGGLNDRRFGIVNYCYDDGHFMDIWMLKEDSTTTMQDSWTMEYCIDRVSAITDYIVREINMRMPIRIMNDKLFLKTDEGFASYNLENKRINERIVKTTNVVFFADGDIYMQNMISLRDMIMSG